MLSPLNADLAYEREATRDRLRQVGPAAGVVFERESSLGDGVLRPGDATVLFVEQCANVEAAAPRIYSLSGSNADLLVVVIVPQPRDAADMTLLRSGAFDVIDLGPDMGAQLARTVAAARRVIALQLERTRLGAELAHHDKLASIGLLAAGVGHEVNNPCGAILANIDSMREGLESVLSRPRFQQVDALQEYAPDWLEAMGDCIGAAKRIHAVVKTLNAFSRKNDGADAQPVDLNAEIATVLRLVGKEIRFQSTFDTAYDPELPEILATPNSVTQIVTNLVVNALQALEAVPAGRRRIQITTGFDETHVMLEVADNGPGIAPEILGRIFDPFFSTKPTGKGSGLGLSITRGLVQKNRGEIFVESEPGRGARFRVLFERGAAAESSAPRPSSSPPASARLRVLIVDDDELLLRSIRRTLGSRFECVALASAEEALASLRDDANVDVVLTDIVMPGMNGVELYESILVSFPNLGPRTAFLTGGITSERLREQVSRTGQPVLEKPVSMDAFVKTIHALGLPEPVFVPLAPRLPIEMAGVAAGRR